MGRIRDFFVDLPRQVDMLLLALCCAASGYGLLMVCSATRYMNSTRNLKVQAAATVIGIILYLLMSLVDIGALTKKGWKWMCLGSAVFIGLLRTPLGRADNTGNRAWLKFPFLPVSIQPAEIAKIVFILVLAYQLVWLREHRDDQLRRFSSVAFLAAHLLALFGLYYVISRDMGSALVYVFIFACMCFVAGMAIRWFVLALLGGGTAFYLLWELDKIPDYMKKRFMVLLDHSFDPLDTGWQQTRGLMTLGGGRLFGQGLFHGVQTQSSVSESLPSRHTDFIFCVIGEELGMVGCLMALALLTAIILRCLRVAKNAQGDLERYVGVGVAGMLIFQVVSNVGMCLFVLPVIGLTLPFFSYGGSSVVMLYAAMGIVSGIHRRARPEWVR